MRKGTSKYDLDAMELHEELFVYADEFPPHLSLALRAKRVRWAAIRFSERNAPKRFSVCCGVDDTVKVTRIK